MDITLKTFKTTLIPLQTINSSLSLYLNLSLSLCNKIALNKNKEKLLTSKKSILLSLSIAECIKTCLNFIQIQTSKT